MNLFLVVMAGGSGTRFWPKSTAKRPKQLLSFGSEDATLLRQTLKRFDEWIPEANQWIVTTRSLEAAIKQDSGRVQILCEPVGRNTAPCIFWAAQEIAKRNPRGIMLVMPSDHLIGDPESFIAVLKRAVEWAETHDDLVTLGIQPTRPETGYGYLLTQAYQGEVRKVEAFVEKPSLYKANEFLHSGKHLWNGGMFVWRVDVILSAFSRWMPEMEQAWGQARGQVEEAYPHMTATSIDYGILEKADNIVTFPLDCQWDDLGSWTSLKISADCLNIRQGENVVSGGDLLAVDSQNNIVDAEGKYVALLGVQDLIVVQQGETLLVAHLSRAQDIRALVEQVKAQRADLT